MPWLTPDLADWGTVCIQVTIPNNETFSAAFRGAIAKLSRSANWEQEGTATPEDCARAFLDLELRNTEMSICVPVGTVLMGAWVSVPTGLLPCDGAEYHKDDYPELFAAIGQQYGGSGDNFLVPNFHRRFPVGLGGDINPGSTGGKENVRLSQSTTHTHNHETIPAEIGLAAPGTMPVWVPSGEPTGYTGDFGLDNAHENQPPYLGMIFLIVAM